MASGLDGINSIERVLSKLLSELHEVTFGKGDLVLETSLFGVLPSPLDLEVVVVQSDNVSVGELGNFPGGSTNTASDVEDAHTRFELHVCREVMLVAGKRVGEGFALVEAGEMEGLSPTILIQLSGTIIIACTNDEPCNKTNNELIDIPLTTSV